MKIKSPGLTFLRPRASGGKANGESAFTMVEIAISLAIIAFALVAIIGVLPIGLDVQKDNRQETIINHDAGFFLDGIRNGARGLDDLTNHVYEIRKYVQEYNSAAIPVPVGNTLTYIYTYTASTRDGTPTSPLFPITNGFRIIGELTTPKIVPVPGGPGFYSNHVVALVRALSGPASENFPQNDASIQGLAFAYRLVTENVRMPAFDTNSSFGKTVQGNLHELRLTFRWPLLPDGSAGNSRQTYRTLVGGQLLQVTDPVGPDPAGYPLHFFQSSTFVNVP